MASRRTKYHQLAGETEQHPVDVAVDRRLKRKHEPLRRRILRDGARVQKGLPEKLRPLFLTFEAAVNERNADREEAHFEVGYEIGLAEGRAQPSQAQGSRARRALAAAIREAVLAEATPEERVGALLDVLAALVSPLAR